MKVVKIDPFNDYREAVSRAIDILKAGGVIVYPTDTVYGLGANACDFRAVEQVFKIKKRPLNKPLPIFVKNINWVREVAFLPPKLEPVLAKIWPGAVTVILPRRKVIPSIVTAGAGSLGVRVPKHTFVEKLLAEFGYPLTATSANISGLEAERDPSAIADSFKNEIWKPDLIIDAGLLPKSLPSTIIDFSTISPKVIRIGSVKPEALAEILALRYAKTNKKRD